MSDSLLTQLGELVGPSGIIVEPAQAQSYYTDWRGIFHGHARAVVRPASTQEAAAVVRTCHATSTPIVPQGGNTGLAAGATPVDLSEAIVLSLSRMNRIRSVDPLGGSIVAEAGCVLTEIQDAAAQVDRFFPLSLGSEGSAQIGGLISTNAGGTGVLRYGTMRAQVLGIEAVLPDGRIVDGLRALRKDNAGYDWKQLFIGAEGTLGVVTAAVLKLHPKLRHRVTALIGTSSPVRALQAFEHLNDELGDALVACELFSDRCVELRCMQRRELARPMAAQPWYMLIEAAASLPGLRDASETALAGLLGAGIADECIVAESGARGEALWEWRESIPESEKREGPSAKHDVSVPIAAIARFIDEATDAVVAGYPGCRVLAFGHVGDGNVHFNVLLPEDGSASGDAINAIVHAVVAGYRGSITAEHGIGRYRRAELPRHRSDTEMELMRSVKRAIDPQNIMNPGCVF